MKIPRIFLHSFLLLMFIAFLFQCKNSEKKNQDSKRNIPDSTTASFSWRAPDTLSLPHNQEGELIRYGRELIANTSYYFGPHGTIAPVSNGMNCQNCHIDAGTQPFGNCFSAVNSIYPVFRPRSGMVESIEFRINDCFQRSLNGKKIDSTSKEMRAMVAYLKWVGKDVPKGVKPKGANIEELAYLNRAADTSKGRLVYVSKCATCHQHNGQGLLRADGLEYTYPPLWGKNSYNTAAGLYRLSRFAGYVKNSMPYGASYQKPQLTNEEAWDVAAYVNSQPRPHKEFKEDWPDINRKSVDYPFGPYADTFSEFQHKYGPFAPIKEAKDATTKAGTK